MLEFFHQGGIFTLLVAAFGVAGTVVCLLHLILALLSRGPDLEGFALGAIGGTLGLGLFGTALGLTQLFSALAAAAPDQKLALGFEGASISLYCLVLALGIAAVEVAIEVLARTIRANRGEEAVLS